MKKTKIKKINKIFLSILSFGFVLFPIFTNFQYHENNLSNKFLNNQKQHSLNKVTSDFDYIPISNNVNAKPVSTCVGFLGNNSANNTLYLTSYEGVTVWKIDVTNDSFINMYYKKVLNINDISLYTIKSWNYLKNIDVIAVTFSDKSGNNATVFGINADTGLIYTPALDWDKKPKLVGNIVKVNNGTNVLWQNSSGQIIASVFGDFAVYSVNTSIISFKNEIKKINNSIVNNSVDAQSAKNMVNSKNGTSINHDTRTIPYVKQNSWSEKNGEKWKLQAVIEGKANSNTNIAIFTDNTAFSNITIETGKSPSDLFLQQAVLVDDNLNPIRNNGNLISYTFESFISYASWINIWNDASSIQKYGYIGKSKGKKQNFIWLTSGIFNAVTELVYDYQNKTLTKNKSFDFQWQTDQDVYTYSYDISENRFFTSNSYTNTDTAIGYIDFDDENLTYKKLVSANTTQDISSWDIDLSNILKFSPVVAENKISQTPLVYFDQNDCTKIKGLYLNESDVNNSSTVDLTRKKYNDIQKEVEKFSWFKERMPSSITEEEILQGLIYDSESSTGNFNKTIEKLEANDLEGTLNVRYKISHNNWWDNSTSSSFYVELTIKGMYSTQESIFTFVSEKNGDSLNDNKLRMQNSFKQSLYPSQVKWEDVCKYFIVSTVKDTGNKIIDFTKDMIELEPNDKIGVLKVKVDYSSKLPTGIAKNYPIYETEFSGFQSLLNTNTQTIMLIVSINVVIILMLALSFILYKIKQTRSKQK